jgi:hypothetical protein
VDKKGKSTSKATFNTFWMWVNHGKLWVEKKENLSLFIKTLSSPIIQKDTHRNSVHTHTYPHLFPNWG